MCKKLEKTDISVEKSMCNTREAIKHTVYAQNAVASSISQTLCAKDTQPY